MLEIHIVEIVPASTESSRGHQYIKDRHAAVKEVRPIIHGNDALYEACGVLAEKSVEELKSGICEQHFLEHLQSRLRLAVGLGILEGRAEVRQSAAHQN